MHLVSPRPAPVLAAAGANGHVPRADPVESRAPADAVLRTEPREGGVAARLCNTHQLSHQNGQEKTCEHLPRGTRWRRLP